MVKSGVILSEYRGYLHCLTNALLCKNELPIIHDCLLWQKANRWLPGALEFNAKVVVGEWSTDYKLVEMLDEVFNAHHENAIVLIPLVGVPATL